MRSRYSAFCTENAPYLLDTWHPSRREAQSLASLQASFEGQRWCRLQVLEASRAGRIAHKGIVEFVAFYQLASGESGQLHERSNFICEQQRWYYVDGKQLPTVKLGRNEPCWCGSGQKLKQCHNAML